MKHVVTHQQVAHLWANKIQDNARNPQGNLYFESDTIYSYGKHFAIASHFKDVVLFTLDKRSVTTAKHIRIVSSAVSHLNVIYCLYPDYARANNHMSNITHWLSNIKSLFDKLARARNKESYVSAIEREINELNIYAEFFKVKLTQQRKALKPVIVEIERLKPIIEAQIKAAQLAKEIRLNEAFPDYQKYVSAWREYKEKDLTTQEKVNADLYEDNAIDSNITMLRTNGTEIETSKGIKFSTEIGKRIFKTYLQKLKSGGCEGCDGWKILDYEVTSAKETGIIVGCHNVSHVEINSVVSKLGWI